MSRTSPAKTAVASRWRDDLSASLPDSLSQNYSDLKLETSHISKRKNLGSPTAKQNHEILRLIIDGNSKAPEHRQRHAVPKLLMRILVIDRDDFLNFCTEIALGFNVGMGLLVFDREMFTPKQVPVEGCLTGQIKEWLAHSAAEQVMSFCSSDFP